MSINLKHDELIGQISARSAEEYARQSDAGESGAKVADFLEKTGLNSQAFSWLKSIMKKRAKKDGDLKALDIISSLEAGLPMVRNEIEGQQPQLPMGDDDDALDPAGTETGADAAFDVDEIDGEDADDEDDINLEDEDDEFGRQLADAAE